MRRRLAPILQIGPRKFVNESGGHRSINQPAPQTLRSFHGSTQNLGDKFYNVAI